LAWAVSWPAPAKATGYTCNSSYGSCIGQCGNNMQLCILDCGTQEQWFAWCFEDQVCWSDGYCIYNDECYDAPQNSCGQYCANQINNCANSCLQSCCQPK